MIIYFFMAIMAGVTITVARLVNTNLALRIGLLQSTLFNYITGLTVSIICLMISGEKLRLTAEVLPRLPAWAFTGGLLGVVVVALSSYTTPKISAFSFAIIVFVGQLFSGILIDCFSFHLISVGKLAGGILVLTGLVWNQWMDKKK